MMTDSPIILQGAVSVFAALRAGVRKVSGVYTSLDRRSEKAGELMGLARGADARFEFVPKKRIDALAGSRTHGGVVAEAGPRSSATLEELLPGSEDAPFIVMLDGVEDPYNLGFALRSLYAAGAHGVVLRERNWAEAESTIIRSSAGASEFLPQAQVSGPQEAVKAYRHLGFTVAVTSRGTKAVSLYETNLTVPLFLILGGERRGIPARLLEDGDLCLEIPYGRDFSNSLSAACAASVLGFEVLRQRRGRSREIGS